MEDYFAPASQAEEQAPGREAALLPPKEAAAPLQAAQREDVPQEATPQDAAPHGATPQDATPQGVTSQDARRSKAEEVYETDMIRENLPCVGEEEVEDLELSPRLSSAEEVFGTDKIRENLPCVGEDSMASKQQEGAFKSERSESATHAGGDFTGAKQRG